MNEKTPLRRPLSYYVLTASSSEAGTESGGGGNNSRNSTQVLKKKKSNSRLSTEQCVIKCSTVLPEKALLPEFEICFALQRVIDGRLRDARKTGDPAPVIIAFTLLAATQYKNVVDTQKFEASAEYRVQAKQNEYQACAITQDQLLIDMSRCKSEYRGVCTVLLYLARLEWRMHLVIQREPYKVKNPSESLLECLWTPCIKGHYYKILVDFAQS